MEYTITFPQSRKNWTNDIELIKSYAQTLREDCHALYHQAKILIKTGSKIETFGLHAWLDSLKIPYEGMYCYMMPVFFCAKQVECETCMADRKAKKKIEKHNQKTRK